MIVSKELIATSIRMIANHLDASPVVIETMTQVHRAHAAQAPDKLFTGIKKRGQKERTGVFALFLEMLTDLHITDKYLRIFICIFPELLESLQKSNAIQNIAEALYATWGIEIGHLCKLFQSFSCN